MTSIGSSGIPATVWMWSLSIGLLSISAGCDRSPTVPEQGSTAGLPAQSVPVELPPPPPKPTSTTSGYAAVAKDLADPLMTSLDQRPLRKELAQLIAEANTKVVRFQTIAASDPLLKRIAQDAADAGTEMVQSQLTQEATAGDDGFGSFVIGAFALYLGDPTMALTAAGDVLSKGEARQAEKMKWASAFNRSRAAQLMLPEAAKAYAGPAQSESLLRVDIDESFAASADHDRIALTNVSGRSLSHATVLVELRSRDGDVRQNVHYVSSWPAGGIRWAQYRIGVDSGGQIFGRQTVFGVEEARVSVWADEASCEDGVYMYTGPERDKDVQALLDGKLSLRCDYRQMPILANGPAAYLTLEEPFQLPAHRVTITFWRREGNSVIDAKAFSWEGSEWNRGFKRTFDTNGGFKFRPTGYDVEIGFPGVGWTWERTYAVGTSPVPAVELIK